MSARQLRRHPSRRARSSSAASSAPASRRRSLRRWSSTRRTSSRSTWRTRTCRAATRRGHPQVVEVWARGQVARAREDGQAVLCRARIIGRGGTRLLGRRQDARRPPEVCQGLDARVLPLRGRQHRLTGRLEGGHGNPEREAGSGRVRGGALRDQLMTHY